MSDGPEDRSAQVLNDLRSEPAYPAAPQPARTVAERMAQLATPGASIAVIDGRAVAWTRGVGVRAAGVGVVDGHTLFQAGSISKPVFALAVMRLVADGVLDLDADVNSYLTSWRVPGNGGWQPRITLRQLLSHSAGTTVHGFPGYPAVGPWPSVPQILSGTPPANNSPVVVALMPGTQFCYSGGGTTIAQQVVADVTGKPFPALMHELVLAPLGMADSTFAQPLPPALAARAAHAHPWNGVATNGGWHVYPEMAAAGLWTTAGDLARLGAAVLRSLDGDGTPLGLTRDSLAAMLRPQLPDERTGDDYYGLGWRCTGKDDAFRFGHMGQDEGFLAEIRLFPARGTGAVVMINSIQGWRLRNELFNAIGRAHGWPQAASAASVVPIAADYAGRYGGADGMMVAVAHEAGGLTLTVGAQPPLPLAPAAPDVFVATALELRVSFEGPAAERPAALSLTQGGRTVRLPRIA